RVAVVVADDGRHRDGVDRRQEPHAAARILRRATRRLLHQEEWLLARRGILGTIDRLPAADQDGLDAPALGWHGHVTRATRSALPWAREPCQGEMAARTLRTPICDLFGIDVPVILAGMGGVSMAPLVAAVSNAGGLGVMGAANLSPDDLREEIRKTKALTKKPFAVDLLAPLPQMIVPYLPILYDEGVKIFVAGLAALGRGAQGAVIGTRFIATPEATAARSYREALVRAEQDETIRTRCYSGKPLRSLKNRYIAEYEADPGKIRPFPEQLMISSQRRVMAYWEAEADPERTCFPGGQGVGGFDVCAPA